MLSANIMTKQQNRSLYHPNDKYSQSIWPLVKVTISISILPTKDNQKLYILLWKKNFKMMKTANIMTNHQNEIFYYLNDKHDQIVWSFVKLAISISTFLKKLGKYDQNDAHSQTIWPSTKMLILSPRWQTWTNDMTNCQIGAQFEKNKHHYTWQPENFMVKW